MYKIPLTNSPNQTFTCTIPVNGENKTFTFNLNYNYIAKYWLMSLSDTQTEQFIVANIPLLSSTYNFANILRQFDYKMIGNAYIAPISSKDAAASMPDNKTISTSYVLLWGDNDE